MIELSDIPPDCSGGTCAPVTVEIDGLTYYTGECQTSEGLPCSADFNDESIGWDAAIAAASAFAESVNGTITRPSCKNRLKAEKIGEYDLGLFTLDVYSGRCIPCVIPIWNKRPNEEGAEVLGYDEGLYYQELQSCGVDPYRPSPTCADGKPAKYIHDGGTFDQGYFLCRGDAVGQAQPGDYGKIPPRQPLPDRCLPPNIASIEPDGTESCYAPCGPNEIFDHNDKLCGCAPGYGRADGTPKSPCVKKDPPKGIVAGRPAKTPSPRLSTGAKVALAAAALGAFGLALHLATRKK